MDPIAELALLLRPAAGGVYLVSTGRAEQLALQMRLYGAASEAEVHARFSERLSRLSEARVILLGVPSDVGAGYRRGANLAPAAIRAALLEHDPVWPAWCEANGVFDVGDVFVVPQLLHDDMLSPAQIAASRNAIYPSHAPPLPVSPLSIEERVLDLLLQLAPRAAPFVLGGDHSVAWPLTAALHRARPGFVIVQVDAHTDLLPERLGIKYCFATWSYHANELLGRGGRLVQVGVRASRFPKDHWETTLGVRQFWSDAVARDPDAAIDAILSHVRATGAQGVYFSNDIDGTDPEHAPATGTPEPKGLSPDFVCTLVQRLGREVDLFAADLVEVAPPLAGDDALHRTLQTAVRYVRTTIESMLTHPP
jgi:agmatinase